MQLTKEEAVARVVAQTILSEADIRGLLDCSPDELGLIVTSIHERHQDPPRETWDTVLAIVRATVGVAEIVIPLTGAIQGIYGVARL